MPRSELIRPGLASRARVFNYIILVQSELDRDDVFDFLHFFSAESPAQLTSLQDFPRQKSELVCQGIAAFGESLGKDLNLYRPAAVDV